MGLTPAEGGRQMTRRRELSEEERRLWSRVAQATTRLQPSPDPAPDASRALHPDPGAPEVTRKAEQGRHSAASLPAGAATPYAARTVAPPTDRLPAREPLQMDRRLHARMTRGKLEPEARLDLHGMTLAQAHMALDAFIRAASRRGLRLVLVITGKGRRSGGHDDPIPRRAGALRHEVPHWLRQAPLRALVLEVHAAHHSHGGAGALYVYLRRQRGG